MAESSPTPKRRRYAWFNVACALGVALVVVAALCFTPLRTLMPGYLTPQSREQVINFALRVDSLEEAVARQNLYVTNLQDILKGRVRIDTVISIDTLTALRAADLMEQSEREKEFARQYEEAEKYNLTNQASRVGNVQGLNLTVPVRGVVEHSFDPNNYLFGVDVTATSGSAVMAALDGTVLVSGYLPESGYTVVLQHNGDLVTVYSHCSVLLHKVGDKVRAGEALATVAAIADDGHAQNIHFELWHKGIALDPSVYIAF